jgi:hypothetical protein
MDLFYIADEYIALGTVAEEYLIVPRSVKFNYSTIREGRSFRPLSGSLSGPLRRRAPQFADTVRWCTSLFADSHRISQERQNRLIGIAEVPKRLKKCICD